MCHRTGALRYGSEHSNAAAAFAWQAFWVSAGLERLRAQIAAGEAPARAGTASVLAWTNA